eukprot:9194537-Heterocapsa_arctica.AAC.1
MEFAAGEIIIFTSPADIFNIVLLSWPRAHRPGPERQDGLQSQPPHRGLRDDRRDGHVPDDRAAERQPRLQQH